LIIHLTSIQGRISEKVSCVERPVYWYKCYLSANAHWSSSNPLVMDLFTHLMG